MSVNPNPSLVEAIGSGLPLIGFDVPYGNQTFIEDGENGYLIPSSSDHVEDEIKKAYAEKICQLYLENHLEGMREKSYQIADALRYAHQQGVIHRNLKPSNVLVTTQGDYVKLIDFSVLSPED